MTELEQLREENKKLKDEIEKLNKMILSDFQELLDEMKNNHYERGEDWKYGK